jgi:5-methyltetrahydropteroyltriglutamate--homocysteine methyltransferase
MSSRIDRIAMTHVGSLPRSAAVTEVVARQKSIGIDFVSDGEMSKISYATYIARRFSGLLRKLADRGSTAKYRRPRCVGPVEPDIAYLKLRSLVEGAQLASGHLWR